MKTALRTLLSMFLFTSLWITAGNTENTPIDHTKLILSVLEEYRKECTKVEDGLIVSGEELNPMITAEGKRAMVIIGSFECEGEGHLWCGSGGCRVDLVIEDQRFAPMLLLKEVPTYLSLERNELTIRTANFEWTTK